MDGYQVVDVAQPDRGMVLVAWKMYWGQNMHIYLLHHTAKNPQP